MEMGSQCQMCCDSSTSADMITIRLFLMTNDIWKVPGSVLRHRGRITSPPVQCCVLPVVKATGLSQLWSHVLSILYACPLVSLNKMGWWEDPTAEPQGWPVASDMSFSVCLCTVLNRRLIHSILMHMQTQPYGCNSWLCCYQSYQYKAIGKLSFLCYPVWQELGSVSVRDTFRQFRLTLCRFHVQQML